MLNHSSFLRVAGVSIRAAIDYSKQFLDFMPFSLMTIRRVDVYLFIFLPLSCNLPSYCKQVHILYICRL